MNRWLRLSLCLVWITAVCCHSPTDLGNSCLLCGIGKPQSSADIDLKSTGAAPTYVAVLPGATVRFHNRDNVSHQVGPASSSPSPCPELSGPVLAPGSTFTAVMANHTEACGFLDQLNTSDQKFSGTIAVANGN